MKNLNGYTQADKLELAEACNAVYTAKAKLQGAIDGLDSLDYRSSESAAALINAAHELESLTALEIQLEAIWSRALGLEEEVVL